MTMASIAADVALRSGVTVEDLKSVDRTRRVAHPRQEAMALMIAAGFTTTQVGRFLGQRDHSTVVYGRQTFERRIAA